MARLVKVVLVKTGVSWMCGLIRAWAASTEARVREAGGAGEDIVAAGEEDHNERSACWGASYKT